ncbi:PREDICTED: uncharacterized protein LOC105459992 [Wasmannia auropunctata]|uniref:uncharacterized protein LOC105459992 n=1 Tax=Wasmannia auropunctata TaxID=64793 RepID=UPI0005F013E0|nr:PREDICTED: uncharacterized protein LOC105459992 [Wasmannia auropunctata]
MSKNMDNLLLYFIISLGHLIYMFIANYIGQKVIDYNNELFQLICSYNGLWYAAPLPTQKLLLFILLREKKHIVLSVFGILIGSLECFAKVKLKFIYLIDNN